MPPHEGTIHCPVCVYRYNTNHRWLRARRCTTSTGRTATPRPPMKEGTQNDLAGHTVSPTRLPYPPSVQTSSSRRNILSAGVLCLR